MSILIAVSDNENPLVKDVLETFKAELPEREFVLSGDLFDRRAVSYAVSWKHKPGALANLPMLEAIFSLGAGVDFLFKDERLPDVALYRVAQDDLTFRMSEYVVLQCLMHLRDQRRFDLQQQKHEWIVGSTPPTASEVRVGIMGMGVLGTDAAYKLKTLGFDVAGWSRAPKSVPDIPVFAGEDGLEALLKRTDILVSLLPLTDQTRGILNLPLFEKLARDGKLAGPVLINPGRGGLQVEEDILKALDDGILAGASLDVFDVEPLPENSALWAHPKVILTPHIAAASEAVKTAKYIANQIKLLEAGKDVPGKVDRSLGY
ncbi:glyoxylate/hydroxypyruvate reductase A [Microvirga sp. W0021]|uniref:Glyoxylate/hydroxypyruvate reductase A n=1 Tax=Hohaiivirga grylli TaxID=3133970 RepID=A0ABV0BGK4_9HYPH